jgi:hypothetical protein
MFDVGGTVADLNLMGCGLHPELLRYRDTPYRSILLLCGTNLNIVLESK